MIFWILLRICVNIFWHLTFELFLKVQQHWFNSLSSYKISLKHYFIISVFLLLLRSQKISKHFYYILFYLIKTTESMSSDTLYKGHLFEKLQEDYRIKEGLKACMNCGVCTAVCPAAEFYKYNPKNIVNIVQRKDEDELETLLKSDTIWYCGECMSCVTRCPRGNAPGLIIMALRKLAMQTGYYMESEKGRQQYILVKDLCGNILNHGYCIYPRNFSYD